MVVSEDDIKVEIVGITGAVVGTGVIFKSAANWLLTIVILFVIGFVIIKRIKKKKMEKGKLS